MSLKELYPLWRKELIAKARCELNISERNLAAVQDRTGLYARSMTAVVHMRRQALAVYENSPETLEDVL